MTKLEVGLRLGIHALDSSDVSAPGPALRAICRPTVAGYGTYKHP